MGIELTFAQRRTMRTNMAPCPRSPLEDKFLRLWRLNDGPPLLEQYRFHPTRMWRADFYHEASRTILELDGGLWKGQAHQTGNGYENNRIRDFEAWLDGYTVLRLVPSMVSGKYLVPMIAKLMEARP